MSKISVIIATKNEERNIKRCLDSIYNQTVRNFEIVLIDNDSKDKTRIIANNYKIKIINLVKNVNLNKIKNIRGAQINFGVNLSAGNIIFFPDADMTFHPKLFEEVLEKIKTHQALFIPEIIIGKGIFGKVRNFERSFYNGTCVDGVRVIKKDIFSRIGGFDTKNIYFGPDDWDLTNSLSINDIKIGITKFPLYHHEENISLFDYLRKKQNYIPTFESYINKWGRNNPFIEKQFSPFYRFFNIFFERNKWKKTFKNLHLYFLFLLLKLLLGVFYIVNRHKKNYNLS